MVYSSRYHRLLIYDIKRNTKIDSMGPFFILTVRGLSLLFICILFFKVLGRIGPWIHTRDNTGSKILNHIQIIQYPYRVERLMDLRVRAPCRHWQLQNQVKKSLLFISTVELRTVEGGKRLYLDNDFVATLVFGKDSDMTC